MNKGTRKQSSIGKRVANINRAGKAAASKGFSASKKLNDAAAKMSKITR